MNAPTRSARVRMAREAVVFGMVGALTVCSAVVAKRGGLGPALAAVEPAPATVEATIDPAPPIQLVASSADALDADVETFADAGVDSIDAPAAPEGDGPRRWVGEDGAEYFTPESGHVRYFDGRPIRPARTVWMVVTAYSPDERSCGVWADGKTASLKSVWTNAMEMVAADTRLLPFGTLLTVPGYAGDRVVPVTDRGGAIKGARLDVLYATHEIALRWGVQRLPVTIWEYADEEPRG